MKVVIYADGGSRGNPGVAGSGTVVYADDGSTILREIAYVVGKKATNNVAEYHGLLRGLEAAREVGASEVEFYMDSKLVVEQMSGRWKIKHPDMQKLALAARKLIDGFSAFSIDWVPRAKNKVADALSNDAMDAAAAGHAPGIVEADGAGSSGAGAGASGAGALGVGAGAAGADAAGASAAGVGADAAGADAGAAGSGAGEAGSDKSGHWFGQRGPVTSFVLVRHGQTQMSVDHVYSGHSDVKLTEFGQKQAVAAAQGLASRWGQQGADRIVASPLARCQETAAAISEVLGCEIETCEDLIELDFGRWEGLTFAQARQRDPQVHADWMADASLPCPEGESLQQLHRRVRAVRKDLQNRYAGQRVIVVSHVNPIKSFIRQGLDAGAGVFSHIYLDLASVSEVDFWPDGSLVRAVNDTGHLAGLE